MCLRSQNNNSRRTTHISKGSTAICLFLTPCQLMEMENLQYPGNLDYRVYNMTIVECYISAAQLAQYATDTDSSLSCQLDSANNVWNMNLTCPYPLTWVDTGDQVGYYVANGFCHFYFSDSFCHFFMSRNSSNFGVNYSLYKVSHVLTWNCF